MTTTPEIKVKRVSHEEDPRIRQNGTGFMVAMTTPLVATGRVYVAFALKGDGSLPFEYVDAVAESFAAFNGDYDRVRTYRDEVVRALYA